VRHLYFYIASDHHARVEKSEAAAGVKIAPWLRHLVCQITTKDFPASWQQACGAAVLIEAGIDTKIDASHSDAHNKIIPIECLV
jgi:hypothetical protein